uniref:Uncharacterized protein n=1 Tax=Kalmanozyma brasiliensis (strain GHG001) TaxID=1365824 RepID=V5E7A9_KALBG
MFGSPDDTSILSHDSDSFLPTISDSDLVRDAKHVHWQHPPFLPDTAQTYPHLHSMDSLIEPDGSSSKAGKGLGGVKAKMKAVVRLLSGSKQQPNAAAAVSAKGLPIAGQTLQPIYIKTTPQVGHEPQRVTRVDTPRPDRNFGAITDSDDPAVIGSIREHLASQHEPQVHPPPPPPSTQLDPQAAITIPPTAVTAKKRIPNAHEIGLGFPEEPRKRSSPEQAVAPGARVASRPLPPTPALQAQSTSLVPQQPLAHEHIPQLGMSHLNYGATVHQTEQPTHVDSASRLTKFPSLRRVNGTINPVRLAEELETLSTLSSSRRSRKPSSYRKPPPSSSASVELDSSQEAVCHWRPSLSPPLPSARLNGAAAYTSHGVKPPSLENSEDESIRRIQDWRVHIKQAPSVLSKAASAHSRFEGDEVSSHLTSVSRSPLSKGEKTSSVSPSRFAQVLDEVSAQYRGSRSPLSKEENETPTMKAKRVVGKAAAASFHGSPRGVRTVSGTSHIARLSDDQFDRLARVAEGPPPPPPTPIPKETTLRPAEEEERRTSLDSTHPTTLSTLEHKAAKHIDTLDGMIRKHPEKMWRILGERPGLMLVVLLRCKVEERLEERRSEVGVGSLVDLTTKHGREERENDGVRAIEESLVGLNFGVMQPTKTDKVPSIVVSRPSSKSDSQAPPSSASTAIVVAPTPAQGQGEDKVDSRGNAALESMVKRLEQAGELCTVQQTLLTLQDKLMSADSEYHRLRDRLSVPQRNQREKRY